jgi:hypothetical protein
VVVGIAVEIVDRGRAVATEAAIGVRVPAESAAESVVESAVLRALPRSNSTS